MKKKTLLTSVLSIAMCSSLIGGATYALFTSESKVNVSVNAGKVDVVATVNGVTAYSYDDENAKVDGVWSNGGVATADLKANTVTLDKITPGDSAVISLNVTNNSNVKIMYRVIVDCASDNGLFEGLNVYVDNVENDGFTYTPWAELAPQVSVENVEVKVELPTTAGNEYQNKACEVNYIVQAVQWNADYAKNEVEGQYYGLQKNDDGAYLINDAIDLKILAENVNNGTYNYEGETVLLNNDVDLNDSWFVPIGTGADKTTWFRGTFEGQGYTISNLKIVADEVNYGVGLFGNLNGTIQNFTLENVTIDTVTSAGAGAAVGVGKASGANVDGVTVKNATIVSNHYIGGVVGSIYGGVNNCYAENVDLSAIPHWNGDSYDNGDKVGGVIGFSQLDNNVKHENNSAKDVYIYGYRDLGGVAGAIDVTDISNFTAENVYITLDQVTYYYGWENMNVGNVVGRPLGGILDTTANTATGDYEVTAVGSSDPVSVTSGEVTLENEYIINTVMTGDAIYANGEGTVVTINGGTYRSIANGATTAVYARDSAKVVINDGTFSVEGGNATIYAKNNAVVEINGGTFYPGSADKNGTKWTLNLSDNTGASIVVKGGRFYGWNPADNKSENPAISFVAPGYEVVQNGNWYEVVLKPITTAEEAQAALDNATDGTTIYLANAINYGDLKLNVNADSVVTEYYYYMSNYGTNFYGQSNWQFVKRTINDLTIIGVEGATINSLTATKPRDDDGNVKGTRNNLFEINNLKITNVTVANKISFNTSDTRVAISDTETTLVPAVTINGLTIDNCKTTTGGDTSQSAGRILLSIGNTGSSSNAKNIVVTNCTVTDMFQGVYLVDGENVRIENNTFTNLTHNAVHVNKHCSGEIVIANNTMDNVTDRSIRFSGVVSGTVTIENNAITNSNGDNGEYFKASSMGAEVALEWANNTIDGVEIVLNTVSGGTVGVKA